MRNKNSSEHRRKVKIGGIEQKVCMAKIRNFAKIAPNLPFTEYDFYEEYRGAFEKTDLGRMKRILPLHEMAESFSLVSKRMAPKRGRRSYFTPEGKVAPMFLKMKTQMSIPNRIVSVNKPYVRPIVRGKEAKNVEFGAKCNNILVDGISFIEKLSFNAFNEGTRLPHCIKMHKRLFGVDVKKIGGVSILRSSRKASGPRRSGRRTLCGRISQE